tara:strand:+ start:81 stop:458 length:378 start_codon:yes stop_codon:yes gene_type:complete
MPRKGKGQQPVRTASGQQYGQVKAQEESQAVVPLAQMEEPQMPSIRPGEMDLTGPTNRPDENIMTPALGKPQVRKLSTERKAQIRAVLPALAIRASDRDASFELRKLVREMKLVVNSDANDEIKI